MSRILSFALTALIAAAVACDDGPVGPSEEGLHYFLVSFNGANLPTQGPPNSGCNVTVQHGSFALDSNGSYSALLDYGPSACPDGSTGYAHRSEAGTYSSSGGEINFQPNGSPSYTGQFGAADGDDVHELILSHPRGEYRFFRVHPD